MNKNAQPNTNAILEEIKKYPQKKIKLAVTDIDGVLRGKEVLLDKFLGIAEGGFGFCDVVFGWDINDRCYENSKFTGWHSGYPDALAKVDFSTYRRVPWDRDIPFFLADFVQKDGAPLSICPRQLLKKIQAQCQELGFQPFFSQEFEWFNFKNTGDNPVPLTQGMFGYSLLRSYQNAPFFNDIFDQLLKFKVPIEGIHTETGPGVYEAAILYSDILEAADRAVLFKAGVKEIAHGHGIFPSFMAKWNENLPGCSGHLHQSLWDEKGKKNLFFDAKDKNKMSDLMKSYMAGVLHCLPYVLPFYAPTINSYKRLVEGAWAPTTVTWAIDNRTTTLRALPGSEKSTRLELRVVGSDVNPYLAMAAALASGLYGIKNKLKLTIPATQGSGYADKKHGILPRTLKEATDQMKNSEVAQEILGEDFISHFAATREWEWAQYSKTVTNWELQRYFEIV